MMLLGLLDQRRDPAGSSDFGSATAVVLPTCAVQCGPDVGPRSRRQFSSTMRLTTSIAWSGLLEVPRSVST